MGFLSSLNKERKRSRKKVTEGIKSIGRDLDEGRRSVGRRIEQAQRGQFRAIERFSPAKNLFDALKPPELQLPAPPAIPGQDTGTLTPDIDLAATEALRRTTGEAKGTRKLRVPLGGLRSR